MASESHLQRIWKAARQHVFRNRAITFASIFVLVVTLSIISLTLFVQAILGFTLDGIEQKADVNVYFLPNAPEEVVLGVRNEVQALANVATIEYISRDEALRNFRERHSNDTLTIQALDELGENPLGASLNIRANEPSDYVDIAAFLSSEGGLPDTTQGLIEKVNYAENAKIIERIDTVTGRARSIGLALAIIFISISILMTINTQRLAMYSSREELSIMQLVGARRRFIQGPFYVAGIIYGVIAALLTLIILYPITRVLSRSTAEFFGGLSLFEYYSANLGSLALLLLAVGIIIGVLGSAITMRSYLKV